MSEDDLVKYHGGLINKVNNAISVTNKLLGESDLQLIPYRKGNKWGFCTSDKIIVIDCIYDSADLFSEGFAAVSQNGKYGYINKQNEIVINFEYDYANSFDNNISIIEKSGKKGLINKKNQTILEPIFDDLYFRSDNYIHIKRENKVGLLDIHCQEFISPNYQDIGIFSNYGLASFAIHGYFGYLNSKGDVVISPKFHCAEEFKNEVAVVGIDKEYFLIDLNGKRISDCFTDLQSPFPDEENLYACSKDDTYFGFIDNTGTEIIPFMYDYVERFSEGLAVFSSDGKSGYIDKANKIIIDEKFDKAFGFSEGLARVEKNNKQGFIDNKGSVVIPFLYDQSSWVTCFENGYVEVVSQNKCGIIDKTGEIIIPLEYTSVFYNAEIDGFLVSENYSTLQFISKNGLKYWEE